MIGEAYQSETDAALQDLALRPKPAPQPEPEFSLWGMTGRAVGRGVAAGAIEIGASAAEISAPFGRVYAALGETPRGMFSVMNEDEQRERTKAANELLTRGPDFEFRNQIGRDIRAGVKEVMPDPITSHQSEMVVADMARSISKIAGGYALFGPAGLYGASAEEGFTQAEHLAEQGVDQSTRTAAGAVIGGMTALGARLPMAGKTWTQTAGLVAAGGPGAFVAQQAAVRGILQSADYSKLADQYDPFDPVGLTLSTVLPLGFGALAMRGVRVRKAADEAGKAVDTPPGERTPMAKAAEAVAHAPDEAVDAARVTLIRDTVDSWNLGRPGDIEAANAHLNALARAADQLSIGGRVDVTDMLPVETLKATRAMDAMIDRMETARVDLMADAAGRSDPGAVRAMRDELDGLRAQVPDTSPAAVKALAHELQQTEGLGFKKAEARAQRQLDDLRTEYEARISRIEDALGKNAEAQQAFDTLNTLDRQLARVRADRADVDAPPTARSPIASAASDVADQVAPPVRAQRPEQGNAQEAAPETPAPRPPATPGEPSLDTPAAEARPEAGAPETAADIASLDARTADIEALRPDMKVMLDGMEEPVPVSELLARLRKEVARESADVPLLQVAAECALRNA